MTDIKQLRFVEEEQRPGLSSNKHRASCSLHASLLLHDSLIPDLPSAEAINHTVEVDLKCLKLPGEDLLNLSYSQPDQEGGKGVFLL